MMADEDFDFLEKVFNKLRSASGTTSRKRTHKIDKF